MNLNLFVIVFCLKEGFSHGEDSIMRGAAHFVPAGRVASPVSYETLALRVDLQPKVNIMDILDGRIDRALEAMKVPGDEHFKKRVKQCTKAHQDRLRQAVNQLKRVLGATGIKVKNKKSLVALAAMLGPLVAVGSALFSHGEVSRMAKELHQQNHYLNSVRRDIQEIHHAFYVLEKREHADHMEDEAVQVINDLLLTLTERYEETIKGIYALRQHQLHPGLVPATILEAMNLHVKNYVKDTGATSVFSIKEELLSLPVSYVEGKEGALILLHIPLVRDGRTMLRNLYRLDGALFFKEGKIVRLRTAEPYISVDKAWELHQTMTEAEVQQCHQVGTTRLCGGNNILMRTAESCTAALLLEDEVAKEQNCLAEEVQMDQPALQVNSTTYAVRKGEKVMLRCPGERPTTRETTGIEMFNVDVNCTLSSPNFVITPPPAEHQDIITIPHQYQVPDMMDLMLTLATDIKEPIQLKNEVLEEIDEEDYGYDPIWFYVLVTVALVTVAGVIVAACCYGRTARRHLQHLKKNIDQDKHKSGPGSGSHRSSGRQLVKDGASTLGQAQVFRGSMASLAGPSTKVKEEEEE